LSIFSGRRTLRRKCERRHLAAEGNAATLSPTVLVQLNKGWNREKSGHKGHPPRTEANTRYNFRNSVSGINDLPITRR